MKTIIIFALLIAGCGYGAFSHFSAEDLKIAKLEKLKENAVAESASVERQLADIRPELDGLKKSLAETLGTGPATELAKARGALEQKRDALRKDLEATKIAAEAESKGPDALIKDIADIGVEIETTTANIQKLDKEYLQLMKYRAAEEAAMPPSKRTGAVRN